MRQCPAPRHLAEVHRQSARPSAKTLGTLVLAGGGTSGLMCAGAFTAQRSYELSASTVLVMYFAAFLVSMITAAVKVYEIRNRRTPDQIHAEAMARQARRHTDPDRAMRILMTDNALSRAERLTSQHSFGLLHTPAEAAQPWKAREPS
jgi:hypothetical protein